MSKVSIRQMKAARALLGWSQSDLARNSGISEPTVKRLEAAEGEVGGRTETGDKLRSALEAGGVEFIAENGGGAGVRLKSSAPRLSRRRLLDALTAFARHHLPRAAEQARVRDLRFVVAGSQATLYQGDRAIGLVTVRANEVSFSPELPTGRSGDGSDVTEDDLWNWVIAAWQKAR
jgi:transcriptional regulator with XRE-family HTH domain